MSDYRAKAGHDENLIDLVVLDPQPTTVGLEYTRVTPAASRAVVREGPFVRFLYSALTESDFTSVLGQFDLTNNETANVTIYAVDELYGPQRYNGLAVRPAIGRNGARRDYFVRDVEILVRDLAAL